jgi:hypothetical protein
MTGSTRRVRWCAHCNVPKSRARPRPPGMHCRTICAHSGVAGHCHRSTCARPWQPPLVRSPQMVVSLKGVAEFTCHNAPGTRQEASSEPSHQGAVRRSNLWRKHARFGGSGTGRERHFVYYFEAHLPRTQAPRGRPPRRRRGRATRHNLRRPIRVEGHQYPAQWARGGEAGEGRVVGQQVGGIWAGRLTEGRSGRVEAIDPGRVMASFSGPPRSLVPMLMI